MKKEKEQLSRRDFLKKAGAMTLAAGMASGLGMQGAFDRSPKKQKHKGVPVNTDYDVIMVGGGPAGCPAGCPAAIAAAREGSRTLLIEAAGIGASMASRMAEVDVHKIDIPHLRKRLTEEGQNI